MLSKDRKIQLSENGSLDLAKQIQYCQRYGSSFVSYDSGEVLLDPETAENLSFMLNTDKDHLDCLKLIHSQNSKYNRLLKRVKKFFELGDCLFLTLTFRDDVLESTSHDTRRKYVRRFLKKYSNAFVANIDFGRKKGREHYHALIVYPDPGMLTGWTYGFSNAKKCFDGVESEKKLTHYILKIANHFVKESVGSDRLIYSVYRSLWTYTPDIEFIHLEAEQLTFWNGMPGNYSNFDKEEYLE